MQSSPMSEVLARQKLRQLLRDENDIEIVGESATSIETIELVRAANPELLFLDIHMPGEEGFDVVGALTGQRTDTRVVAHLHHSL